MIQKKKVLAGLCSLTMLTLVASGCGNGNSASGEAGETTASSLPSESESTAAATDAAALISTAAEETDVTAITRIRANNIALINHSAGRQYIQELINLTNSVHPSSMDWVNDEGKVSRKAAFTYDERGLLLEQVDTHPRGMGHFAGDAKELTYTYSYDEYGSETSYESWDYKSTASYEYDEKGNALKEKGSSTAEDDNGTTETSYEVSYEYDSLGRLAGYSRDSDGEKDTMTVTYASDDDWIPSLIQYTDTDTTEEYNLTVSDGLITSMVSTSDDSKDVYDISYNDNGTLDTIRASYSSSDESSETTLKYHYDDGSVQDTPHAMSADEIAASNAALVNQCTGILLMPGSEISEGSVPYFPIDDYVFAYDMSQSSQRPSSADITTIRNVITDSGETEEQNTVAHVYSFDENGHLTKDNDLIYTYNDEGYLVKEEYPSLFECDHSYETDAEGRVEKMTVTSVSKAGQYTPSIVDHDTWQTSAVSGTTVGYTYTYDDSGLISGFTVALESITSEDKDTAAEITEAFVPYQYTCTMEDGRITEIVFQPREGDPSNHNEESFYFTYDENQRIIALTSIIALYDMDDKFVRFSDGSDPTYTFTYDDNGLLTEKVHISMFTEEADSTTEYLYE